MRKFIK